MPDSRKIDTLHPAFQPLVRGWLDDCEAHGYPVLVVATMRDLATSEAYYAQGRKHPDEVNRLRAVAKLGLLKPPFPVTNIVITNAMPGYSWHNYGLAVDFAPIVDGKPDWKWDPSDPKDHYDEIADLAAARGMTWGGGWRTFKDAPHVEWHPGWTIKNANAWRLSNLDQLWLPLT